MKRKHAQTIKLDMPLPTAGEKLRHRSLQGRGATPRSAPEKVTRISNVRVLRDHVLAIDDLWVKGGKIMNPQARFWDSKSSDHFDPDEVIDGQGLIVAPGFIDIQINGAFGVDYSDPAVTLEQIQKTAKGYLQYGVTSFCPTVISSTPETYRRVIPKFKLSKPSPGGAGVLGLHLEGPFMNKQKKGAHDINNLHDPERGLQSVLETYGDNLENVRIVTLAPELEGSLDAVKALRSKGVVVSAGHTMSDMSSAVAAVEVKAAGATMVTHLFNAMPAFHHRDPGIVGLLGTQSTQPFYGIIADGIHCHPASVKIAYLSHPDGAILVTDAMEALGLAPGLHKLGQMQVRITPDRAVIEGTDTLAGSIVSMDRCLRGFRKFTGCSVVEALEAASLHPAQALGLNHRIGSLHEGADADFVFVDDELVVHATYTAGQLGWASESSTIGRDVAANPPKPRPLVHTPSDVFVHYKIKTM